MEKLWIFTMLGAVGATITSFLGGWDTSLKTLVILMVIDYITGMMVAGVFHASKKTDTGALKSSVGFKGLCRKGMALAIVLVAARLDITVGTNFFRDAVVIGYIANESLSIIENAGLMGLPVPEVITKGIDALKNKGE